jgi:hypothetical protein
MPGSADWVALSILPSSVEILDNDVQRPLI